MSTIIRSHASLEDLRRRGLPLISGDRYIPASLFSKKTISLAQGRRILSKIKGSLAETVSKIRDEE